MNSLGLLLLLSALVGVIIQPISPKSPCSSTRSYGKNCHGVCNCKCHGTNDTCLREWACSDSYMGPQCQHKRRTLLGRNRKLFDNKKETCIFFEDQKIDLILTYQSFPFTWMTVIWETEPANIEIKPYITVKDGLRSNKEEAELKEEIRQFQISKLRTDVHGRFKGLMTTLSLKIDKNVSVCEIYISEGRNVALDQVVSVVGKPKTTNLDPQVIVDGREKVLYNPKFQDYCWVAGKQGETLPSVTIQFNRIVSIWQYEMGLYQEGQRVRCTAPYFVVKAWNNGSLVDTYSRTDLKERTYRSAGRIFRESEIYVSKITIETLRDTDYPCSDPVFTLCEFTAYGDSICPLGKWGRRCDRDCHCKEEEDYPSTGSCPNGCANGYYIEGCNKVCKHGTWGNNCTQTCPKSCEKTCKPSTGKCSGGSPGPIANSVFGLMASVVAWFVVAIDIGLPNTPMVVAMN